MTRRALILGGTAWLGCEIARALLADGADVTCAARGTSGGAPEGARFVTTDRTWPGAYDDLVGEWDEVVELSYAPELVSPALDALADRVGHWTLVSTVSVHAGNEPGSDESAPLIEPSDLAEYADAKVAAERASAARLGDRLLTVRPGLIVGAGDPSDRFGYWPGRLARGGRVLVPPVARRHVQVVEVTDIADFVAAASRDGVSGVVNAVGDSVPWADFLDISGSVTDFDGEFVTASDEWLRSRRVNFWAGPRSLPLWLPEEDAGFALRSNARFRAHVRRLSPLRDTVARVLEDEQQRGLERERRSGLTTHEEAELVEALSPQNLP